MTQEQPNTSQDLLKTLLLRADAFSKVRSFFSEKKVLEVDTQALNPAAQIDRYIDPIKTNGGYLHTSPEHGMKRLLAAGSPDIYQICHVFRKEEKGPLHNPEFTMIEWYRKNISFESFIEENLALIALFLPNLPNESFTYAQAFQNHLNIDPLTITLKQLQSLCPELSPSVDPDTYLHYLYATKIEPHLGQNCLTTITNFPASQAALAKLSPDKKTALRFEIYHNAIELANGFDELTSSTEQRARYRTENIHNLPLDEPFLTSLDSLPPCCGSALGFDRLLMLQIKATSIASVIPLL